MQFSIKGLLLATALIAAGIHGLLLVPVLDERVNSALAAAVVVAVWLGSGAALGLSVGILTQQKLQWVLRGFWIQVFAALCLIIYQSM